MCNGFSWFSFRQTLYHEEAGLLPYVKPKLKQALQVHSEQSPDPNFVGSDTLEGSHDVGFSFN